LIEDEIKEELRASLEPHGLDVDNFYLSSLTPLEGVVIEEEKISVAELPKTEEEIKDQRIISNENRDGMNF